MHEGDGGAATIIVADRISTAARRELRRAGLAWFDRRGHLSGQGPWSLRQCRSVLRASGAFPKGRQRIQRNRSRCGPGATRGTPRSHRVCMPLPARSIALRAGCLRFCPSSGAQGLVGSDNRPFVPELFWAVAEEWKPRWYPMPQTPPPDPPERFRLGGTLGAVSLGAPVAAEPREGGPGSTSPTTPIWPRWWAPMAPPSGWTGSQRVAVCPSRYGFTLTSSKSRDCFLVANSLIVALDLAQDRAHGPRDTRRLEPSGDRPCLVNAAWRTPGWHRW